MSATRPSLRHLVLTLCLAATAISACAGEGTADKPDPDASQMTEGLNLFYQRAEPQAATALFRQVLERTPTHYGARYQLAAALDSSGRPAEARPQWQEMLRMAEEIGDTAVAATVRRRLAAPDTASQVAAMRLGLHYLYVTDSAAAAVEQFRALLRRNPTHYGATFQLATALDRVNQPAEARTVWIRMLGMATAITDTATMSRVRTRLQQ